MSTPSSHPADPVATEPETQNSELETPSYPKGCGPLLPEHRTRHHWKPFRRRWRKDTELTDDVADNMYEFVERYGVNDACAARTYKVTTSNLARWKQEYPEFEDFLQEARS